MKNNIFTILALFIILSSCSKSKSNLEVIPEDSQAVVTINFLSMLKKIDLSDLSEMKFVKAMKKEIKNENKDAGELFEDLTKNPLNTGLDFYSDLYMFGIKEGKRDFYFCTSIALKNKTKFKKYIETIFDKADSEYEFVEEDKYQYFIVDKITIAFDDSKAVIIVSDRRDQDDLIDKTEELMTLSKNKQITKDKNFNKYISNKKDISFWVSSNILEGERELKQVEDMYGIDLADNYFSSFLDFKDGKILFTTDLNLSKDVKEKFMQFNAIDNNFNGNLLKYFPEEYLALGSSSFKPEVIAKSLRESEDIEKYYETVEKQMNFSIDEFIENLGGSYFVDLYDFEITDSRYGSNKKTMPIAGMVFDFKNKEILYDFLNQIPGEILIDKGDYFKIDMPTVGEVFIALNDNVFYIGNDKTVAKTIKVKDFEKNNLSKSDISNKIESSSSFVSLNLDINEYPSSIKKEIYKGLRGNDKVIVEIWEDFARDINISAINENTFEVSLNLKEEDENSLNTFFKLIDDNYENLMEL